MSADFSHQLDCLHIRSSTGGYAVSIAPGSIDWLRNRHPDSVVLADAFFRNALPFDPARIIFVVATEDNKSLECVPPLVARLRELGANRTTHLIAVGGGIIQDIATFIASIYMRGVSWTYAPTTLLAMTDSCIGGKSSINVGGYKNLVGNFYPPAEVIADLNFVRTLNVAQIVDGLCEAAKICYAKGAFEAYRAAAPTVQADPEMAARVVRSSLRAKQWFIEVDEFDRKERLLLNFGHTFGHAIESASHFAISHGVAVGIGILVAEAYARANGFLRPDGECRCAEFTSHIASLLGLVPSLADAVRKLDMAQAMAKFDSDKKHKSDAYRIVVPVDDGALSLLNLPRTPETRAELEASFTAGFERVMATELA
jgi:3-dehydroquinate synthase